MLDPTQPMPEQSMSPEQPLQGSPAPNMMQEQQGNPQEQQQRQPHIMAGQDRDYKANPLNDDDRDQFDKISVQATKLIHLPQSRPKILERIGGKAHPFKDIADAAVAVMGMIDQQSVKEKQPTDKAVRMLGYIDIAKQITDLAVAAGKLKEKPTEQDMKVIIARVVQKDQSNLLNSGDIPKEVMQKGIEGATAKALESSGGSVVGASNIATAERNKGKKVAQKNRESMNKQLNGDLTTTEQLEGGLLNG